MLILNRSLLQSKIHKDAFTDSRLTLTNFIKFVIHRKFPLTG